MWKCDKCGKEFKNTNQEHYCGEKPKTIDDYISAQSEELWPLLNQVRNTIREALPNCYSYIIKSYILIIS